MAKQKIFPFFIPMEGCPHRCIFCDQMAISGKDASPTAEEIINALAGFQGGPEAEVAFYGGSFTCLPRERQRYYLEAAAPALHDQRIGGIRISTRPDALDEDTCAFLRGYGVRTVELGVQSFDAGVLTAAERGYGPDAAQTACRTVVQAGLRLGVQLMTGLPQDDCQKDIEAVRMSGELGAGLLRIYPTLVLEHTRLACLYAEGAYAPQTLGQAVDCCADMAIVAIAQGMTLIRIGINPSPAVEAALVAGPYHPAFGGLVKEAVKKAQIAELLGNYDAGKIGALFFPPKDQSLLWGQHAAAVRELGAKYPSLALIPDCDLNPGELRMVCGRQRYLSVEKAFCQRAAAKLT